MNAGIPKATNTNSKYVILIAFSLQQWLHQNVSLLRYMYIASLFILGATLRNFFRNGELWTREKSVDECMFVRYVSLLAHVIDMQSFMWCRNWILVTPTGETPSQMQRKILHFPLASAAPTHKFSIDPLLWPLRYFVIPWIQRICRLLMYTVLESDIIIIIIIIIPRWRN